MPMEGTILKSKDQLINEFSALIPFGWFFIVKGKNISSELKDGLMNC
jgi:hypothetical protein